MAGDALQKVVGGQRLRIPAGAYNSFVDSALDFQRRQRDQGAKSRPAQVQSGIILVRNDSGGDRQRFDVLGVAGPLYGPSDNLDEFKNRPAVTGVTPLVADHKGRFVVLMEPVRAGGLARALAVGVSPVTVDVEDEAHKFADVADGICGNLASGSDGAAAIMWKEPGTGLHWALVRFPAGGGGGLPRWQPAPPATP